MGGCKRDSLTTELSRRHCRCNKVASNETYFMMRPKISKLFCQKRGKKLPNASSKLPPTTSSLMKAAHIASISFIIVREQKCMCVCKQKAHHSFLHFFLLFSRHFNFRNVVAWRNVLLFFFVAVAFVEMSWKQKKVLKIDVKHFLRMSNFF